ncbi:MAG: GNAT family N-acetyltransferase [Oscillospiraceae bacterium]|nr:GNAT family N-acetyltransferase [Oscillospiraceae bacterium]
MSLETGPSRRGDVPALKALWKQAFGDGDACIGAFFDTLYRPETVLTVREDEQVRAMVCWLPETICFGRRGWPAAYLYAVATEESARGRGLCGRLLAYAAGFLASQGFRTLLLVPGEASLRGFYARHGYADYTAVSLLEAEAAPGAGRLEEVSAPEYLELREAMLAGRAYVSCPVPVLSYQRAVARQYGGGLYRLERDGYTALACAALDAAGRAVVYELLTPAVPRDDAAFLAHALGADRALARTPGGETPFAMARWLAPPPDCPPPYLGIALD